MFQFDCKGIICFTRIQSSKHTYSFAVYFMKDIKLKKGGNQLLIDTMSMKIVV